MRPEGLVALVGDSSSSCGYCHSSPNETSHSYGIWAYQMSPMQYQNLIDNGWRRSGQYLYKPMLDKTCCPQYTIRLNVSRFKLSKSSKKVIRKIKKYLNDDQHSPVEISGTKVDNAQESCSSESRLNNESQLQNSQTGTSLNEKRKADLEGHSNIIEQRKTEKKQKNDSNSQEQDIVKLIQEAENIGGPLLNQKLRVEMKRACFEQDSFNLYCKYQQHIHQDDIEELTESKYTRFLVSNPLKYQEIPGTNLAYGAFHQKYWINDKLVAIAVIDVLPKCLSSVYFCYDPDYSHLSLGVYSALREIYYTKHNLSAIGIDYYYMGYYIHSCDKMNYKANYSPSELLCPKRYTWVPVEQCLQWLDINPRVVLSESTNESIIEFKGNYSLPLQASANLDEIKHLQCLVSKRLVPLEVSLF